MKKILIAGEGGQGVQSVAEIMALAAHKANLSANYIPNFGVEQRGGVSIAYLQIDHQPITYPKFDTADILVMTCNRAVSSSKKFIDEHTLVIFDSSFIEDKFLQELQGVVKKYLALPAKKIAQEKFSIKSTNMVLLGALSQGIAEVPREVISVAIDEKFAAHPEFKEGNAGAYETGYQFALSKPDQQFKGLVKGELKNLFEDEAKSWQRFPEYCKGCMLCAVRCPKQAISMSQDLNFLGTNMPVVDLAKCVACGTCQQTCPDGAIKVHKK